MQIVTMCTGRYNKGISTNLFIIIIGISNSQLFRGIKPLFKNSMFFITLVENSCFSLCRYSYILERKLGQYDGL